MASDFSIRQGTLAPSLTATLLDGAGAPINLTDATGTFRMRSQVGGALAVDRAVIVVSALAGTVRVDWQAPDTAVPGTYNAEFLIVLGNGLTEAVPSREYLTVTVTPGLG